MPVLRTCPRCQMPAASRASRCRHCGAAFPRKGLRAGEVFLVAGGVLALAAVLYVGFAPGDAPATAPAAVATVPVAPPVTPPASEPTPTPAPAGGTTPSSPDLKTVIQQTAPAVVRIDVRLAKGGAVGSGFVCARGGYVLTNQHVVDAAQRILVTGADGKQHAATLVNHDAAVDLALLKVPDLADTPPLTIAESGSLQQGEHVLAVGSPEGLTNTVSDGIISALHRKISVDSGHELQDMIQTTAPISHGSSGGPLVRVETGAAIGVTSAGSESGANLGFAISGDTVLATLKRWGVR